MKEIKDELFEVILPKLDEKLSTNKDYGLILGALFYEYLITIQISSREEPLKKFKNISDFL